MKFQVNQRWAIGQFLIPPSTIIDIADKAEHELSEWERLARGRVPPIDATALDFDAALVMWRNYPEFHHRLRLHLDAENREMFERLLAMDDATLERWGKRA